MPHVLATMTIAPDIVGAELLVRGVYARAKVML